MAIAAFLFLNHSMLNNIATLIIPLSYMLKCITAWPSWLSRISGMEWWNGMLEWNTGMIQIAQFLTIPSCLEKI